MARRRSFLAQLARTSHQVSKYSGDLSALQRGGVPAYARRVTRRAATRSGFAAGRRIVRYFR